MELLLIGCAIAGLWMIWTRSRNGPGGGSPTTSRAGLGGLSGKSCRWKSVGDGSGTLHEFQCKTCGVTAYSTEKRGPKQCKKGLEGSKL